MKLILKQAVTHLGQPGDLVEVANGYGRNYLLPKNLAVPATKANIATVEQQMGKLRAAAAEQRAAAEAVAERLSVVVLTMSRKVIEGEESSLYGSVSVVDIGDALDERGFDVDRGHIHLEQPIKEVGEHTVPIALSHGVIGTVKVNVVAEEEGS